MNGLLLQDGDAVEEISFEALFSSKLKKPKAGGGSKKLPVPADAGKQGRRFSQEKKAQHKDGAVKQKRKLPAIDASDRDDGEGDPAALGGLDGASGSHARDGSSGAKRPRLNAEQGRGPAPGGGGGGGKIKLTWPYPVDYLDHFGALRCLACAAADPD